MLSTSPFYSYSVQIFQQSPLFSDLKEADLGPFLGLCRRETWEPQAPITIDPVERFVVVTKGRVELVRTDYATGRDLTLLLLHPGDVFDVVSLLDGAPHDLRPIALDPVTVLSLPLTAMRDWLQRHPGLNHKLLHYLTHQMRAMEDFAADLTFHDTGTRLERLLTHDLLPGHQPLNTTSQPHPLVHDLSHEVLARMIGSVRGVVNRHIQQWKKNGSVRTSRKHLVILNMTGLEGSVAKNGCKG